MPASQHTIPVNNDTHLININDEVWLINTSSGTWTFTCQDPNGVFAGDHNWPPPGTLAAGAKCGPYKANAAGTITINSQSSPILTLCTITISSS